MAENPDFTEEEQQDMDAALDSLEQEDDEEDEDV